MTYHLHIGDYAYSSWSLRAWLLFDRFDIPFDKTLVNFLKGPVAGQMARLIPARTVPCLTLEDGTRVWDSLAIAEELASRHPEAGLWPSDPAARATARSLAAEMHAGFSALRTDCPMNLHTAYEQVPVSEPLALDLQRLEVLWSTARRLHGGDGPWLCGAYSVADAFFAPVAARITGYGLSVSDDARAYVTAHLADPAFRRWRSMALARNSTLPWYSRDYPQADWPGPAPVPARAVPQGPAVNTACPFSGKPVTDFAEIGGSVVGFCNPFCRDKSVADPDAWPQVVRVYQI
jgi:glutathione S-transferase